MSDIELTRDAKKLLKVIYRTYRRRIRAGKTKDEACQFKIGDLQKIAGEMGWKNDDAFAVERELGNAGLIRPYSLYTFNLNTKGICYMEGLWLKRIKGAIEWLAGLLKPV